MCLSSILYASAGQAPRAQEADPLHDLEQLLEQGRTAAAAERAAQVLATTTPANRTDSIAVFVATRVYVGARLQESRYEDPTLAGRISSLFLLSEALFGENSPFLVDAFLYAGMLAKGEGAPDVALEHFRSALVKVESQNPAMPMQEAQARQGLAEVFFQLQRYPEAKREFELELKARQALAPDGLPVGIALINLNEARQATHDTLGMGAAYARAQRIFARQEGEASARHADAHYREGAWRFASGQIPDAASALDRALDAFAGGEGPGQALAECLLLRAQVHLAADDPAAAIEAATRARLHFLEIGESAAADVALCFLTVGHAQRASFRRDEATASYLEALRIYEENALTNSAPFANCLRTLASHCLDLARYEEALGYAQRSLALSPRIWGARSSETAIARLAYAATLRGAQLPDSARIHYELARDDLLATVGGTSPLLAEPLLRLGTLARERGDLAAARAAAEQALALLAGAHNTESPRLADCHHELGIIKRLLGDARGARSELEQALELASQAGPDSELKAAILSSLALLERSLAEEDEAWVMFQEALRIMERVHSPTHPRHALILRNLASLANARGRFTEAKELYTRALASLETTLGPRHPDVAATRLGLGNALKAMGALADARTQYEAAIDIHVAALGPEAPALALDYHNLAALLLEEGQLDSAMAQAEIAERLGRQHFQLIAQGVSEREALHFAARRVRGTDIVLTAAGRSRQPRAWERAWDLVVRSRGAVLEEIAARHRFSMQNREPAVIALAASLKQASSELAYLAVRGSAGSEPLAAFKARLAAARMKKEAAERALAEKSREYRDWRAHEDIGLGAVLAALPERSVLVAWLRYERLEAAAGGAAPDQRRGVAHYAAFAVDAAARNVRFVPLAPAAEIEALVAQWRAEASRNPGPALAGDRTEQACRRAGEALRQKIWDPIFAKPIAAERVFLVPDAALCLVNFNALPAADGGFLVEQAPLLLTLATERGLAMPGQATGQGSGLLTMGEPDYATRSQPAADGAERDGQRGVPCGQFKALRFQPLPGTARETEAVARLWRSSCADSVCQLVGREASEQNFRSLAGGRRVLHVATHGFFLGTDCVATPMKTDYAEPDELTVGGLVAESPLLLSGMALSGANLRGEASSSINDGILTAEEIAGIDLQGVDLAVLSACGTGLGKVEAGEGVLGLRRAFQLAGVRNLLMSLWAVDDAATVAWMQDFFAGALPEGADPDAAVREASLAAIRQRRAETLTDHPFFWGAFITTKG